jgi:hypothetical protein
VRLYSPWKALSTGVGQHDYPCPRSCVHEGSGQCDCTCSCVGKALRQAWISLGRLPAQAGVSTVLALVPGRLIAHAWISLALVSWVSTVLALVSRKALSTSVGSTTVLALKTRRFLAQARLSTTVLTLVTKKALRAGSATVLGLVSWKAFSTGVARCDWTRSCGRLLAQAVSASVLVLALVSWKAPGFTRSCVQEGS